MNKAIFILVAFLIGFSTPILRAQDAKPNRLELSGLDLKKVEQPYWVAQKDKAIDGKQMIIRGQKFKSGIGTISKSKISIILNGKSERFKAWVGVQKLQRDLNEDKIEFNALGDGSKLFYTKNSEKMNFVGVAKLLN